MRISTRLFAAASFAAMSLLAGAALADGDSLVFGTDATYPPFESPDAARKFIGFAIDITHALCD
ncbi:MAG: amino acid ABC transporter, partial [Cupriavidus sp.]